MPTSPAQRWADALAAWAIPDEILAQAPEDPWVHPPAMFKANPASDPTDTPSHRMARASLRLSCEASSPDAADASTRQGSVLDVGVGGGRSCLPLVPLATELAGVDEQAEMLELFAAACGDAGVPCHTYLGRWPDVAANVPVADVVACHHVAYNVAAIEPFLRALTDHARRLVVVELPAEHPTAWMNPLWERFWGLARPSEPSAGLFVEVVRSLGWLPDVAWSERAPRNAVALHSPDFVAFCRRRLCLPADRDPEVAAALVDIATPAVHLVAAVSWHPT